MSRWAGSYKDAGRLGGALGGWVLDQTELGWNRMLVL